MDRGVRRIEIGETRRDSRGWVVDLVKAAGLPISSLAGGHAASLEPGAVRGNHYHEQATEWLLLFSGPARLLWQAPGDDSIRDEQIGEGDPVIFEIPARCPHRIENISSCPIYLTAFYDRDESGAVPFDGFPPGRRE